MPHATTQITSALSTSLRRNASALASSTPRAKRGEVRGIHRLRVATRRLREAVPAAAEIAAIDETDADALVRELRGLTKSLGPVRELDVARAVLADFAEREAWPAAVVGRVESYCDRLREQAFADALETIAQINVRETRRSLNALLKGLADGKGSSSLGGRLREAARTLGRNINEAGTIYAPHALHEIRIAAKKLRYVVELVGQGVPGTLRRLRTLQSALGRLHDAQVLQHRIQELAATSRDRGLVATLTSMERTIESTCREWHAGVLKTLPAMSELAAGLAREVPASIRPRSLGRPVRMAGVRPQALDRRRRRRSIA
jgi:CHAD domain-containing protein